MCRFITLLPPILEVAFFIDQLDQRQIILKIPKEITTGHARSWSDGLDKLKLEMLGNSLRQENASKESPVACDLETDYKNTSVTLKTVQFQ